VKHTGYLILIPVGLSVLVAFWVKAHRRSAPLTQVDLAYVAGLLTGVGSASWLVCNCIAALVTEVTAPDPKCVCPTPPLSDNQLWLATVLGVVAVLAGLSRLWQRWKDIVPPTDSVSERPA
jgi:hypothetical protein